MTAKPLEELMAETAYAGYTYAYPHKSAYRRLTAPVPLEEAWRREPKNALFLYMHVPFCSMRCGFCNLFTLAQPDRARVRGYLDAIERQARPAARALGSEPRFARFALGGGTPTFLDAAELERLFAVASETMGAEIGSIPASVETSPDSAEHERLAFLREVGVDRISIGVQSFDAARAKALGRPQKRADVHRAIRAIQDLGFPTLNIDLIYGGGETLDEWRANVREALTYEPEELYLYPLYIRPLTGLGRSGRACSDARLAAYRAGRDLLLDRGYRQLSMRYFRAEHAPDLDAPVYSCQTDGMVGLGPGARSYTARLHYSSEYAVGRSGVRSILDGFIESSGEAFELVDYGCRLTEDERRRRFTMQSLLLSEGLTRDLYRFTFGEDVLSHLPGLVELERLGLALITSDRIRLTPSGLERSDVVGPWLGSAAIRQRMEQFQCQ